MNGGEFIRRVRKRGRFTGVYVHFESRPGKGSHGRLYYGVKFTTVKDRKKEIGVGLLHAMLDQLGLTIEDIL
jgi:mRNA interferase HicA